MKNKSWGVVSSDYRLGLKGHNKSFLPKSPALKWHGKAKNKK
jgi:hypothetical protein